jgi:hypothetical protein
MRETLDDRVHLVAGESRPLRWYVSMLADVIRERRRVPLVDALTIDNQPLTKTNMIGGFCALLELVKLGLVTATQASQEDPVELIMREDSEEDFDALIHLSRFMDEEAQETFPGDEDLNPQTPVEPPGGGSQESDGPLPDSDLEDPTQEG